MTGLQTVHCHIAGMGLGIVLLEEKIVSNCIQYERSAGHAGEGIYPHCIGL